MVWLLACWLLVFSLLCFDFEFGVWVVAALLCFDLWVVLFSFVFVSWFYLDYLRWLARCCLLFGLACGCCFKAGDLLVFFIWADCLFWAGLFMVDDLLVMLFTWLALFGWYWLLFICLVCWFDYCLWLLVVCLLCYGFEFCCLAVYFQLFVCLIIVL